MKVHRVLISSSSAFLFCKYLLVYSVSKTLIERKSEIVEVFDQALDFWVSSILYSYSHQYSLESH